MVEVRLYIQSGHSSYEIPLASNSITIGRGDEAGLIVADTGLSRIHASIYRNAEAVWIVDENSTNGSFVNGREVPAGGTLLGDGDLISIGEHTTVSIKVGSRASRQPIMPQPAYNARRAAARATAPSGSSFWSPPVIAAASAIVIIIIAVIALVSIQVFTGDDPERAAASKPDAHAREADDKPAEDYTGDEYVKTEVPLTSAGETSEAPPPKEPTTAKGIPADEALRKALLQVVEDRQEPMGYEAAVDVPAELKHYSERKRFLAVQTAEALQQRLRIPHDFAELITLIREKQLVELKPLGDNYVLYGVGGVSDEEFTHFDRATGKSVPLYRTLAELQAGLNAMPEKDERRSFIASFYKDKKAFKLMASEYETISELARDFDGQSYDLKDGAARKALKKRLLSFVRPAARRILEDLALAYKNRFNRPLPIASVIRTEQYQRELSERNVNAAHNSLPPHTTGLAFDISYRYMTAAEQNFLMAEIARLKDAGRVEALRENNNCFHVFAFVDGQRPSESLVRKSMS